MRKTDTENKKIQDWFLTKIESLCRDKEFELDFDIFIEQEGMNRLGAQVCFEGHMMNLRETLGSSPRGVDSLSPTV